MSRDVRFCPQCGREISFEEFNCSTYCRFCGYEYRQLQVIQKPQPPKPVQKTGFVDQTILGIQHTQRFAQENPAAFAVTATGVGATGIFLGPMVASAGKVVMIAGGIMVGLGLLINDEESKEALLKTGGVVLLGGVGLTGAGYVMTGAGAVSAATGLGVGTYAAGKGTYRAIGRMRERRRPTKTNPSESGEIIIRERNKMNTCVEKLFDLGQTVMTPGALEVLNEAGQLPGEFLGRHQSGDWGDLCEEDAQVNQEALENGLRIMSVYRTSNGSKIWVITEADRSATTLLLPEEY